MAVPFTDYQQGYVDGLNKAEQLLQETREQERDHNNFILNVLEEKIKAAALNFLSVVHS